MGETARRAQDWLSAAEIAARAPAPPRAAGASPGAPLSRGLERAGQAGPFQLAGRHFAMGCVALEITQRCNLDCTLCYLSDVSESVRDLPLTEIFRRIDRIRHDYGPNTNVQITGGDPTLRARDELIAIVARVRSRGLTPALFTNGIKATRPLLKDLAAAGLRDVAFHVDMTQNRKGYASEADLNAVRKTYMARARGLGLHVIFNTTVFDGNFGDVAMLAGFFRDHADDVRMASFQLQADTGRGMLRRREEALTIPAVEARIAQGARLPLTFDRPQIGHSDCNRYTSCFVAGADATPVFDDAAFFADLFRAGEAFRFDRHRPSRTAAALFRLAATRPALALRAGRYAVRKLWALRRGLATARGRVRKLTYYIHNFMDAEHLDRSRCEACVFMTMTRDGPVSMCVHNAKRDTLILQPVDGLDAPLAPGAAAGTAPLKQLKGRMRAARLRAAQTVAPK